ncbi:MAG: hypothetical protein ACKOQM_02460 [Novosphingobium sp.]
MIDAKDKRVEELRSLAAQIMLIADDIERQQEFPQVSDQARRKSYLSSLDSSGTDQLIIRASEMYRTRRRRKRYLPPDLFAEPAWDLLLDLFIARLYNKRVSITSACYAADVPSTTGLRWLGILADRNLIERFDSKNDQRVTWVRLSNFGTKLMRELFEDISKFDHQKLIALDDYLISKADEKQL